MNQPDDGERLSDLVGRELTVHARIAALDSAVRFRKDETSDPWSIVLVARQFEEWILRETS